MLIGFLVTALQSEGEGEEEDHSRCYIGTMSIPVYPLFRSSTVLPTNIKVGSFIKGHNGTSDNGLILKRSL